MTNEELFNTNIKIAYKIASTYLVNHKNEYEDIKQLALLGLWKAVLTFKDTHKFSSYAYPVITNEINYYLRRNKKLKNNVSIEQETGEGITIGDTLKDEIDYIEKIEDKEAIDKFIQKKFTKLKPQEKRIWLLTISGKRQKYIAKKLNISQAQVSRTLNKFKKEQI